MDAIEAVPVPEEVASDPTPANYRVWDAGAEAAWCVGERDCWGEPFRHWIELTLKDGTVIRGEESLYRSPCFLQHEGRQFMALTAYYDGSFPIETVLEVKP